MISHNDPPKPQWATPQAMYSIKWRNCTDARLTLLTYNLTRLESTSKVFTSKVLKDFLTLNFVIDMIY